VFSIFIFFKNQLQCADDQILSSNATKKKMKKLAEMIREYRPISDYFYLRVSDRWKLMILFPCDRSNSFKYNSRSLNSLNKRICDIEYTSIL
jgi:hypothetical protein